MSRTILTNRDLASSNAESATIKAETPDGYSDRLMKYIPGEVIALYITLGGVTAASQWSTSFWVNAVLFLFCFLATPLYLILIAKVAKRGQVVISTLAFVVWALAIGGMLRVCLIEPGPVRQLLETWGAKGDSVKGLLDFGSSILLILFTFLAPLLSPGDLRDKA